VPQAQTAQQRLKHASAPPCFGQVPIFSKVHRREGYLASVRINLVIFALFFCSSAECFSPAAAALRGFRERSGHQPGHHGHVRATGATSIDSTASKIHRYEGYLTSEHMELVISAL
jgi:hypothetical protein